MLTESHYRYMVNEAQDCLDWLKGRSAVDFGGVDDLEKILRRAILRLEKPACDSDANTALSDLFAAHEALRTLYLRSEKA